MPGDDRPILNDEQRRAVDHTDGPLIVLAGPGTGKTRVIIHRVERLIRDGAEPEQIVALTFTVKAATELRERLAALVGASAADRVHAHTFHGFGQRLVRRFGDMLGLPPQPVLIDHAQRKRLARKAARDHALFRSVIADGLDSLIEDALALIDALRHAGKFPVDAVAYAGKWAARLDSPAHGLDEPALAAARVEQERFAEIARLYEALDAESRRRGQLTFEDFILLPIRLLREHPAAAAICRDDYRHAVVDEFQDVNAGQIEFLRQLFPPDTRRPPDLCVVGDDDQSIYLFRGADDRAFEKFQRAWTNAGQIPLTRNYRSEKPVIAVAAAVIGAAATRFAPDKVVLISEARENAAPAPGAAVECVLTDDDTMQFGELISAMIKLDQSARPGRSLRDYAVIARTHTDLGRIHAALSLEDIPARLARGPSALEDRAVLDLLRWVELLADPAAVWAAQWLLTRPPFGVPADRSAGWLLSYGAEWSRHGAGEEGRRDPGRFIEWLERTHGGDRPVRAFLDLHSRLRDGAARADAYRALLEIIRGADVVHADLPTERDRARRVGFLAEFLRFVHDRLPLLEPPADLRAFWRYYSDLDKPEEAFRTDAAELLDGSAGNGADERPDAVTLLTAHSAKGLEFDTVFLIGLEEGLMPHSRALADDDSLEEERRLCYVGMTRAKGTLQLSWAQSRQLFGQRRLSEPSRFLAELPREALCVTGEGPAAAPAWGRRSGARAGGAVLREELPFQERVVAVPDADGLVLRAGVRVRHPLFGVGTVLRTEGSGPDMKLTVAFAGVGAKRLVARYAGLEPA